MDNVVSYVLTALAALAMRVVEFSVYEGWESDGSEKAKQESGIR